MGQVLILSHARLKLLVNASQVASLPRRCSVKRTRLCNFFIPNKRDSHTGDTQRIRKRFLLMQETKHKQP